MTLVFGQSTSQFNNYSTNQQSPGAFRSEVTHLVLWFIYLFIFKLVVTYVANLCASVAAIRTTRAIRSAFLESTLRQEVWHFDRESIGSAASQVTTNGNRINQGLADKLVFIIQGLSLFFSAFIIALAVQWKLSLIVMSIVPAIFVVTGACIAADAIQETRITKIYSRAAVMAQDAISSIKTVHAFWAHHKIVERYDESLEAAHQVGKKKSPIYGVLFSTEYFLVLSGTALAFWQGYRMYRSGEIADVGTVITVVLSVIIGSTAMSMVAPQIQSITNAASAAAELFVTIDKKSQLDPLSIDGVVPETCAGRIEVRELSFAYPSRPNAQVLHQLNLTIPAGKTTALVGASGCGKSTLVGLLERWYEPTSGEILLDGLSISRYNTKWLRSSVRLVQQEPVLFRGTVYDNVAKGLLDHHRELPYEKQRQLIEEACQASNAHEFISDLPNGYETQVGERASMLSGGQRQRIAIARSIIADPKVLLLDEATSALDPKAEGIVQDALNRVAKNRTTLIIAHKLATVKAADNIVVMAHGEVLEQGTHQELIDRDGQYASLVKAQGLGTYAEEDTVEDRANLVSAKRPDLSLQRTKTDAASIIIGSDFDPLTAGTLDYSLIRCIYLMFLEQKDLYIHFFLAMLACLVGGGTYPAQAVLESRLIRVFTLTGEEGQHQADFLALMFFVIALANLVAYFVIGWICNKVGQTVTRRYRKEMFARIMNFDQDFFDRPENASGALTSKLSTTPNSLQELISANILLIFIVLVNVVSSSALAIAFGWKLGLVVVFGGFPVQIIAGYLRIRLEQKFEVESGERFAESASLATEAVTSIRTISSLTLERQFLNEYSEILDGIVSGSARSLIWTMIWYALSQSIEFLILALGFWYGSRLVASGEYTVTQFFTIFLSVVFGAQAASQFFGYTTSITKARGAANYILWLRTIQPTMRENEDNKDIGPPTDGPISLENVEFRYKQRDAARVLKGVSIKIDSGSYVACVGPSGCGKSTLVSLLERFYDPTSGHITLSDREVSSMSPRLYRNHMSLVQQEPTLYQWDVRDNITLGLDYQPSDEEILEACRLANAFDFVSSLPQGLATSCGSKGSQMSGGQKQRIAIARALIRKPKLLLLDEATSALDTQSERIVQKALDEAATTRTTLAVAHRLSTIRHADMIFVFANGRIAEAGTHEELQRLKGRYYEMCISQSLDKS
ncbi:putative ABC transporter [Polychaeton citri CBS 116435]|uniref:ABC transporter n=1 Tax=Polychaeton citri CBS 116435 TaxID=1314669 RepID=A0A9P4Q123_9PEZI|nr:putative ABC transporter [Polychaeton citri CBS 116435]